MILQPFSTNSLGSLSDVLLGVPVAGDILFFNGAKWVNVQPGIGPPLTTGPGIMTLAGVQTATGHKIWEVPATGYAITIQNDTDAGSFSIMAPVTFSEDNLIGVPKVLAKEGQYVRVTKGSPIDQAEFNNVEVDSWRLEFVNATTLRLQPVGESNASNVVTGKINIDSQVVQFTTAPTVSFSGADSTNNYYIYASFASPTGPLILQKSITAPSGGGDFTTHKIMAGNRANRFVGQVHWDQSLLTITTNSTLSVRNRPAKNLVNDCRLAIGFRISSGGLSPWGSSGAPAPVPTVDIPRKEFIVPSVVATGSPVTVTSVAHGLTTGMVVYVQGMTFATSGPGSPLGGSPPNLFIVTVTGADTFTLDGSVAVGANTAVGTWTVYADTLWLLPHKGNRVMTFPGSVWGSNWVETIIPDAGLSIRPPLAASNRPYDIFAVNRAGVVQLILGTWASTTSRGYNLRRQDGVLVATGSSDGAVYLGTIVSGATIALGGSVMIDSETERYCWNYYNRVPRMIYKKYAGADNSSYTYTGDWRQALADTSNQVSVVIGLQDSTFVLGGQTTVEGSAATTTASVGIGIDGANPLPPNSIVANWTGDGKTSLVYSVNHLPAIGVHTYRMMESAGGAGTATFFANSTVSGSYHFGGISGRLDC